MKLFWLLFLLIAVELPYKLGTFTSVSLFETTGLSLLFILGSIGLLLPVIRTLRTIRTPWWTIAVVGGISILWLATPWLVRNVGMAPETLINANPRRFLVRLEAPIWTMKFFEVIFQQAAFIYLFFVILGQLPKKRMMPVFTGIVAAMHLVNFFFRDPATSLFFFLLSIPMAAGFSWLLMKRYLLIPASIHLAFYIVYFGSYWVFPGQ